MDAEGRSSDSPPLYRKLKESIKNNILEGRWPQGRRIPSEAELGRYYGVSRITVRKALEELTGEGYLNRKRGRGTFVNSVLIEQRLSKFYSFSQAMYDKGFQEKAELMEFGIINCDDYVASQLGVSAGEALYQIERVRYVGLIPYAFEQSFVPCLTAPGLTANMVSGKGLYRSLNNQRVFLDSATERLRAVNMPEETAALLKCPAGSAAMLLERVAFSGGQKVEYCRSIIRGDLLSYTVELK